MMSNEQINRVLRYCLGHCDSDEETKIVEWVGEKFAEHERVFARERREREELRRLNPESLALIERMT